MIAFSRIKDSIACAIIIGAILGWCIMLIPDYGREDEERNRTERLFYQPCSEGNSLCKAERTSDKAASQ